MASSVGVVVVTYESDAVLPGLLDSLAEHEPETPVVVVDDASPDGPPGVAGHELLVCAANQGYAAACNRGVEALRYHGVEHVGLLNPDVRLQGPSLTELAGHLRERRRVGIATGPIVSPQGERLPSAWGPTSVRRALAFAAGVETAGRMRSAAGAVLRSRVATADASTVMDDLRVTGHVMGGTMVVRLSCFDGLGGFDEDFFLYWEDADLCHRARKAGWEVRVLPCTPFVNLVNPASSPVPDAARWEWFAEGAARFGSKHLVPGQARQLEAALALGRRLARLRQRG